MSEIAALMKLAARVTEVGKVSGEVAALQKQQGAVQQWLEQLCVSIGQSNGLSYC